MHKALLKHAGIGTAAGVILTFVPLLSLVAPLVGGGVAGYLERNGARNGMVAGALAGAFIAAAGFVLRTVFAALRFGVEGVFPVAGLPLPTLVAAFFIGAFFTVIAAAGTVIVAGVGGALGGVLEEDRHRRRTEEAVSTTVPGSKPKTRRLVAAAASLVAGGATFLAVALGLTALLDPYIWPSALVGLPVGALAGAAVAVLGYHVLTTGRGKRGEQRDSSGVH